MKARGRRVWEGTEDTGEGKRLEMHQSNIWKGSQEVNAHEASVAWPTSSVIPAMGGGGGQQPRMRSPARDGAANGGGWGHKALLIALSDRLRKTKGLN